uniref:Uncharacterized protein n=1 Tax=Brassica oleracea TaxID=3712 RepID=A0A3P6AUU6_BRAOL|nr:unnamed protein product [Brassica oleracea]
METGRKHCLEPHNALLETKTDKGRLETLKSREFFTIFHKFK